MNDLYELAERIPELAELLEAVEALLEASEPMYGYRCGRYMQIGYEVPTEEFAALIELFEEEEEDYI